MSKNDSKSTTSRCVDHILVDKWNDFKDVFYRY